MKAQPIKRKATPRNDGTRWNENKGRGFKPKLETVAPVEHVMQSTIRIYVGDVRERLKELADESVHCVVTSPPYFGLRDYGTAKWEGGDPKCDHAPIFRPGSDRADGKVKLVSHRSRDGVVGLQKAKRCKCGARRIDSQIGLEPTPDEFVTAMVEVFREIRRVLRNDGTCWLNLGDSYAGPNNGYSGDDRPSNQNSIARGNKGARAAGQIRKMGVGLKTKDLIGIPWRVAFALQADGWWLRSDIIWAKPNPMPESITDRPTSTHEHIFLLAKSERYFFDAEAVRERAVTENLPGRNVTDTRTTYGVGGGNTGLSAHLQNMHVNGLPTSRNIRNVWTIATQPFPGAHFATFPPALVEPCIKAGTSEKGCCSKCGAPYVRVLEASKGDAFKQSIRDDGRPDGAERRKIGGGQKEWDSYVPPKTLGWQPSCKCDAPLALCTVLDPFGGSGTVGAVCNELRRNAVLIELNPVYAKMAENRIADFFANVEIVR